MRITRMLLLLLALAGGARAQTFDDALDRLGAALTFTSADASLRAKLSGSLDLECYALERPNAGLLFTDRATFLNPRLALFLDARAGDRLYAFAQIRADRGFDPGADTARLRVDEIAVRYALSADRSSLLEVGKSATVVGNWVARHASRENPFISAPLPYELVLAIAADEPPASPADFKPPPPDEKYEYSPLIWGPSYTTGASLRGTQGRLDYALEIKDRSLASAPSDWSLRHVSFSQPTWSARVALRPDIRWTLGTSFSDGAYLGPAARSALPAATTLGDFRERVWAQDVAFAWHQWQVWAEFFHGSFDVPRVGRVRTASGYLETRCKLDAANYVALRLNRQTFSSPATLHRAWGADAWRADVAFGHRLSSYVHVKFELGELWRDGERSQLVAATQLTLRF